MNYYHSESAYNSLHDMIDVDMSSDMDVMYPHNDGTKPITTSAQVSPNTTTTASQYGDAPQAKMVKMESDHSTCGNHNLNDLAVPQKQLDLNSSVSNLSWLQTLQQRENCNPNLMVNPQTVSPMSQSVPGSPQQNVRVISLPQNLQISGGNIQYVPNTSQQVFIATKPSGNTQAQQQQLFHRSSASPNYIVSPNSAPTSTVADNPFPKPAYSYSCLIALALKNSKHGSLPVAEIYSFMTRHFPYFKTAPDGWKNSVRHNLSLNKCFEKIENPNADGTNSRKGCLWALNPAKLKKMDEEILKWNKKDPLAIKRAMIHPEILELLERGQEPFMSPTSKPQPRHPMIQPAQTNHQGSLGRHAMRVIPALQSPMTGHHVTISGGQQTVQNDFKFCEDTGSFFSGHEELALDPALSELALQHGIWDDLPSDILDIPLSHSPTSFITSPKKLSPAPSPDNRYNQNTLHMMTASNGGQGHDFNPSRVLTAN